jgi:GH24 family phage-related lysozyme (muramidase)
VEAGFDDKLKDCFYTTVLYSKSTRLIYKQISAKLSHQQFDALTSYVFNDWSLGANLKNDLTAGNYTHAVLQMDVVTVNGSIVKVWQLVIK